MNMQFRFAIMAGAAVALLALAPAPLWAQETDAIGAEMVENLRRIKQFEGWLKQAEAGRLRGDCLRVAELDEMFQNFHSSDPVSAQILADFQRRMREIALDDCPPGSGKPSISLPPAPPAPQSTPAPPTAVPVAPAPVGSAGTTGGTPPPAGTGEAPPKGLPPAGGAAPKPTGADPTESEPFESILDEIDEVPQPEPRRTAPPVPPKPAEEIHVPPRPFPMPPPVPPRKPERTPVPPPPFATPTQSSLNLNPFAKDVLAAHNAARAAVGAPPLKWVPALEASATAHAGKMAQAGQLVHAPREGRGIERENLLQAPIGYSTGQMMQRWTGESRYFVPGIYPNVCTGDWSQCAHYSQMIWPTTTDLGCGMVPDGGSNWLVCRYSPGGNKDGKPVGQPPLLVGEQP